MKLLLDQGLPRSAAGLLCAVGIDAVHVGEIGFATAEDASIIEVAQQQERTILHRISPSAHAEQRRSMSGATERADSRCPSSA